MRLLKKLHASESAQVLPMFVMLLVVLIGMIGLATDLGRVYVARAQLGRSVDAAALAGAKQLPDLAKADSIARLYIAENEPNATINVQVYPNVASQQVGVTATKSVKTIFMKLFGIGTVDVSNEATAGFGVIPVDAVMAIDNTASMGDAPCTSGSDNSTSGCPIHEAKVAATNFTNTLLPGSNTVVGVTGFRGCYTPSGGASANCVPTSSIGALDATASNVTSKIALMNGNGGSGTNVCSGLDMANTVLFGTNSHTAANTIREVIILSDGDNNYNSIAYVSGSPGSPVAACRPSTTGCPVSPSSSCDPSASDASPACGAAQPRERELDNLTLARAAQMKAAGVEIFVVAFGVCGTEDGKVPATAAGVLTAGYCANIGNVDADTVADQRLLKCVAASSNGTNDHYFRANTATALPGIFSAIAQNIAFRLVK